MIENEVRAWSEPVVIPTYGCGTPNRNPMFLEKRVYQGSSGVVYPHPMIDRVEDAPRPRTWTAVLLENRWLKIMVLPELGGRVQMALDKTNGYHFVYYNRVIKPALVGLCGPWVSGGIEFNWPQHHRPSTYMPVDWRIEERADGGKTIWCSEIERMFRTKGMHGLTLHPDRAVLEVKVQLYNRTSEPQKFLWWANPAVHVNDDYQSVFPPDVHAVMDHGKRDVSDFPIATGVYYKKDYAPGTDISRYKNIPVPTSYMAYHSDFDFVGCYDHGRQAGMLHVANHHIAPGKKQWTWGCGDFGQAWDRNLTDEDGPYVELMCGVYTDNQPDFTWLMPGEEKRFSQFFFPYKHIGPSKNASTETAVNLELTGSMARIGVYVTRPRDVRIRLRRGPRSVFERTTRLDPETAFVEDVPLAEGCRSQELTLEVLADDRRLISYTPLPDERPPIPEPATAARPPTEIASNEELHLNGLHLEQYSHATCAPEPYYEEALRRDPGDSRCHNALGLLLYRRGQFAEAEQHFRAAIRRLTLRNPNPYDGEAFYNLGLALKMQGRRDEAFAAFYKAAWNEAWQSAAYFELARLACWRRDWEEALDLILRCLERNARHHRAYHLHVAILRKLERRQDALPVAEAALRIDPFNAGVVRERDLLSRGDEAAAPKPEGAADDLTEIALDYAHAGLFDEARDLLDAAPPGDFMRAYYAGWIETLRGENDEAAHLFRQAAEQPREYAFPQRLECVPALLSALERNPGDALAAYALGNFLYARRRHEDAIRYWGQARSLDPLFPTVWRNLALAYMNKRHDSQAALAALERAFELDPSDARVLFELDQLLKRCNVPPAERLERLSRHQALVRERDDLTTEWITLLNLTGRHRAALDTLLGRRFHPWEGGEGKVTSQYVVSLVELARAALAEGRHADAIEFLNRARAYPSNLGEGRLPVATENNVLYYLGLAHEALGQSSMAHACFEQAATGVYELHSALYYNDQPPEMVFYQGLSRRKLDEEGAAAAVFRRLTEYGSTHLTDNVQMDYFAVSLPDFLVFDEDLNHRNRVDCHYLMALGLLGMEQLAQAREQLDAVLALDASHLGAHMHRGLLVSIGGVAR